MNPFIFIVFVNFMNFFLLMHQTLVIFILKSVQEYFYAKFILFPLICLEELLYDICEQLILYIEHKEVYFTQRKIKLKLCCGLSISEVFYFQKLKFHKGWVVIPTSYKPSYKVEFHFFLSSSTSNCDVLILVISSFQF